MDYPKQMTFNGGNVNTSVTFTKNEVPKVKGRVTVQNSYNCGSGSTSVSITIKNYASSGETYTLTQPIGYIFPLKEKTIY